MGLDWAGVICVFFGTLLLTSGKPLARAFGFLAMLLANWYFFWFGLTISSEALMFSSAVFVVLNFYGIYRNILYLKGK